MHWVYVLRSPKDSRLYTGVTADLRRRIREHNLGKVRSTRSRCPLSLVYYEVFDTRKDALARESYLKTPEGGSLKQILARGCGPLQRMSVSDTGPPCYT
jgi:putative endonuclease